MPVASIRSREPCQAALVIGGRGPDALRTTLEAITASPSNVHCAVQTEEEATAACGFGDVTLLRPWPGQRAALASLVKRAKFAPKDVVQTIVAGSLPDPDAAKRLIRKRRSAGLLIPTDRRWAAVRLTGSLGMRWTRVRPGAGMSLRADALEDLAAKGWFAGQGLPLTTIRSVTGRMRFASHGQRSNQRMQTPPSRPQDTSTRLTTTVLIPAHNEEACIGDTVLSLLSQTRTAESVIVIDDGSTDSTGDISRHLGAEVLRTPGTGSKGAAINYGLASIKTDVVVIVDADTRLHPEALDHLMREMETGADATHGAVLPIGERGIWARGRVVEYSTAIRLHKRVQRTIGPIVVLSGCILAVRTQALRAVGGFQARTIVEDLDLTWTLHQRGFKVTYAPRALAYPTEPATWAQYKGQMRRWSRGLFQTIQVHARSARRTPALSLMVIAAIWDVITAPVVLLVLLALAVLGPEPEIAANTFLAWQVFWATAAILLAASVVGLRRSLVNAPSYLVTSALASYFYFEAFITEWVLRRRLNTWVKGH